MYASVYNGSSWGTIADIGFCGSFSDSQALACDPYENAIVVWTAYDYNADIDEIRYSILNGTSWTTESVINTESESGYGSYVKFNKTGDAMLLYTEHVPTNSPDYQPLVYREFK